MIFQSFAFQFGILRYLNDDLVFNSKRSGSFIKSHFSLLLTMAENSESINSTPAGKGNGGRKAKTEYGKMSFRLPVDHERALRYASLMLEKTPNAASTPQAMVEDAVSRYIELLRKKGVEFHESILPVKPA